MRIELDFKNQELEDVIYELDNILNEDSKPILWKLYDKLVECTK